VPVLGRPHHVGIACRSIEPVRRWVHDTHDVISDSGVVHDPLQRADLCLLSLNGSLAIELVSGEAVLGLLKRAQSYYHMCYEVDDIDAAARTLTASRCRLIREPAPAVLFDGRRVCFALGPAGLVELLESR
jgi:methylmalonyl-CoA/ethylmalonyl-CoA epimerase